MNKNSTPLLEYDDLKDFTNDLVADAFGIDQMLRTLLPPPDALICNPSERVMEELFEKISNNARVH